MRARAWLLLRHRDQAARHVDGAPPSSGPTVTPTDPTTTPISGPPTVKGTFTLGSGAPLAGSMVQLSAVDSVPADGTSAAPTVVGTATIAADGSWSFTLPATLPAGLQSQKISAGNGRYEHDIWGSKGPVWNNPGVLYSD